VEVLVNAFFEKRVNGLLGLALLIERAPSAAGLEYLAAGIDMIVQKNARLLQVRAAESSPRIPLP
jgi:hypothetical protein